MSRAWIPLVLLAVSACGKTGPPRPPAPRGPLAPTAVEARQLGAAVQVAFTLPAPRGGSRSQELGRGEVLRVAYPPQVTPPTDPEAFRLRGEVVAQVDASAVGAGERLFLMDRGLGSLADGGIGWTLRYGVRVQDQKGRPSALVVAHDLAMVAPTAAPPELRGEATADGVRLVWPAPPASADATYNVYRGPAEGALGERPLNVEPLDGEEYLDTTAKQGERFRYVVRTVAAKGPPYRESDSSPAVEVDARDRFAPARPTGAVAVQEGKAVRLLWDPGAERDLEGYRVYRRRGQEPWTMMGSDVLRQPSYLDTGVAPGDALSYRVTAIDRASPPNESEPSDEAAIQVGSEP